MIQLSLDSINEHNNYYVMLSPKGDYIATIEGKGFYAAIIVENRNPKLDLIVADFESTAQVLTADKPS